MFSFNVATVDSPFKYFTDVAMMALNDQSYSIFLTASEVILSMMLNMGLYPLFFKYAMFYFNVATTDSSFKYFTVVVMMSLDDQL